MKAESVLDVGCGTGQLLHQARVGRPYRALVRTRSRRRHARRGARKRSDIEWVRGDLSTAHLGSASSTSW